MITMKERTDIRRVSKPSKSVLSAVEVYTPERKAQFLLTNAVDAEDYRRTCRLVRKMGLDPAAIDHDKPLGVR